MHPTCMLQVAKPLFILIFLLSGTELFSQGGCIPYNSSLFALKVDYPDDWKLKPNDIRIDLVNEDSLPYEYGFKVVYDRVYAGGTLECLLNTPKSLKQKSPAQVWSYWPGLPDDVYTVQIPTKSNNYYQARIMVQRKNQIDTFYHYLPKSQAFSICETGLDSMENSTAYLSHAAQMPIITIDLPQPITGRVISDNPTAVIIKCTLDTGSIGFNGRMDVRIRQLNIYDAATLALMQSIQTPEAVWTYMPSTDAKYPPEGIEFIYPQPQKIEKGVPLIKLLKEDYYDANTKYHYKKFLFYYYDTISKTYALKPDLSEKFNVTIDDKNRIYGYDLLFIDFRNYIDRYQYLDKQGWVYIDRKVTLNIPESEAEWPSAECLDVEIPHYLLPPVFPRKGMYDTHAISDSIPVYNRCDGKIGFAIDYVKDQFQLSAPQFLKGGDTTYIIIKQNGPAGQAIHPLEKEINLVFRDGTNKRITYTAFSVWTECAQRDTNTGKILRYVSPVNTNEPTVKVLEVDSNGRPTAYGDALPATLKKVGMWRQWDSTGKEIPAARYEKHYYLSIMNPSRLGATTTAAVWVAGVKQEVDLIPYLTNFHCWLPENMDSLQVVSGKNMFRGAIGPRYIQNTNALYIYLKEPQEDYLRLDYNKVPVNWQKDTYVIQWADMAYDHQTDEMLMAKLKKTYPELFKSIPQVWTWPNPTFYLGDLDPARKKQLLKSLINDPDIANVSQAFIPGDGEPTFAYNYLYVSFDAWARPEQIQAVADKYQARKEYVSLAPNQFYFKFDNTVLDAEWMKLMDSIYQEPGVIGVSIGMYSEVTYDLIPED